MALGINVTIAETSEHYIFFSFPSLLIIWQFHSRVLLIDLFAIESLKARKYQTEACMKHARQDQGQNFRVKIKYWCGVTLQTVRIEETTSKMNIEVHFNAISYHFQLSNLTRVIFLSLFIYFLIIRTSVYRYFLLKAIKRLKVLFVCLRFCMATRQLASRIYL